MAVRFRLQWPSFSTIFCGSGKHEFEHGNQVRQAAVGGIETNGKAMTGPKVHGNQHNLTRIGMPHLPVYQLCVHRLLPIISITTKRPSAKEPMSCTKKCNQLNGPVNRGWPAEISLISEPMNCHIEVYEISLFGFCPKDVIKVSFGPGVAQSRCS